MIPLLPSSSSSHPLVQKYFKTLKSEGFQGDPASRQTDRIALSTDNSIYQILPAGVLYPRNREDVVLALKIASRSEYRSLCFSSKGGGTGTNGQFLNSGLIFDFSKFMNRVLEIDPVNGTARVEPGISLDMLNARLKEHGYFFSPNVSTSNRATIGGMASTDASGKGSVIYGKTSDHILEIQGAFFDGETFHTSIRKNAEEAIASEISPRLCEVHRLLAEVQTTQGDEIQQKFPQLNRSLTAYNLAMVNESDQWNLNKLLCGSEGTLCFFLELKLHLNRLPKFSQVVIVEYSNFNAALKHAKRIAQFSPSAIETMDETVMNLAKTDTSWKKLKPDRRENFHPETRTISIVEFVSEEPGKVESQTAKLTEEVNREDNSENLQAYIPETPEETKVFWEIRKKGVGLLANMQGERRPIAFIEDCATPPEVLPEFIADFAALLQSHNLKYGMYGHADAGCMHVRPALDLTNPADRPLIRKLSDEVNRLVQSYGGILWGEHGRGFRAEYSREYFGEDLVKSMRRLKKIFDPENRMNPGKLFAPEGMEENLPKLDEAPFRGISDAQITPQTRKLYSSAFYCNGNGECVNSLPQSIMCPSSKITRDPVHSPKGRASIMREWLRRIEPETAEVALNSFPPKASIFQEIKKRIAFAKDLPPEDFNKEVYDAMVGCLSCKACTTQCPVHVDIPELKAKFLGLYHTRYPRPWRDFLLKRMETDSLWLEFFPRISNTLLKNPLSRILLDRIGFVDAPPMSVPSFRKHQKNWRFRISETAHEIPDLQKSVILLQDSFSRFYDAQTLKNAYLLLEKFGFKPYFAPYFPSGKPLHIKGFLEEFKKKAENACEKLDSFAERKIPILCVEPSVGLLFREEYKEYLPPEKVPEVRLLQEFLADRESLPIFSGEGKEKTRYRFFGHCTEKTSVGQTFENWKKLFFHCGLDLEPVGTGCCGMAGVYGHEKRHLEESKGLYRLSWEKEVVETSPDRIVASGYSCRSQIKRMSGILVRHPVSALFDQIRNRRPNRE